MSNKQQRLSLLKEQLRRVKAKDGLIDFSRYTLPSYRPTSHHRLIASKLEAVERGEIKRLMMQMPPRHGKSELASRRFPAWALGRDKDKQLISASYNSELAGDFGRDVRNIIRSPEYDKIFPDVSLAKDSMAAMRWHTNGLGGYVAAGIGTAVTGRGAHIFTIDDPVKDRDEADSETKRRKTYEWYTSTAYTRLEGGVLGFEDDDDDAWLWDDVGGAVADGLVKPFDGAIVLIQTRWHDDDLSGKLLLDMENGADQWDILNLPATTEEDTTALWPSKYPVERLMKIKKAIGNRDWQSLYQQNPTPEDGTYFKRDWIRWYNSRNAPKCYNYIFSDYATKDGEGDFTVHMVIGVGVDGNYYIRDMYRRQTDSGVWVDSLFNLESVYKPMFTWGEKGGIFNTVLPSIKKKMKETKQYFRIDGMASITDKPTRARAFQALMSNGKVFFPVDEPWTDDLITEILNFPAGKHDDMVDTLSMMGRQVDTMKTPTNVVKVVKDKSGYDPYKSEESKETWRT